MGTCRGGGGDVQVRSSGLYKVGKGWSSGLGSHKSVMIGDFPLGRGVWVVSGFGVAYMRERGVLCS